MRRPALDRQLFFVVGCQKSGTTWLQKLLDAHPNVRCDGEARLASVLFPLMRQLQQEYNGRQKTGPHGNLTDQDTLVLCRAAVDRLYNHWLGDREPQIRALGEKTPEHALFLPDLLTAFPRMKVIHIIRDGRDCCVSGYFHNLRTNPDEFRQRFPTLADYARFMARAHWVAYVQSARAFALQWPDRCVEVRYEHLHADPRPQVARLLGFLGVDASDAAVDGCVAAGSFESLAAGRPRGAEDRASFFRKGVVGDWHGHLTGAALDAFTAEAGPLLAELGYA